jgi:AmiR/NasT family two-component response regulator
MQGKLARRREVLNEQLQAALDSRVAIEQAKGLLAGRFDLDMAEAFELMRSFARRTNRRLGDVAREVANGTVEPADLRQR